MITITDSAAVKIKDLILEENDPSLKVRAFVQGGGCSGFQYNFDLIEQAEEDDLRIQRDEAVALIDPLSLELLIGSEIDFVDELAVAEFRVRNPNAKSSCGCGVSFSI